MLEQSMKKSSFVAFDGLTENSFNDEEQITLAHFVEKLHRRGAKIVISNSDPKNSDA